MSTKTEQFKNYYDIQGNLLSGDLTLSIDPETRETLAYVGGIRVFRIVDNHLKVLVTVRTGDKVSHMLVAKAVVSKDPQTMFSYEDNVQMVLPELTNFRLAIEPSKGKMDIYKQQPDNSWVQGSFAENTKFIIDSTGAKEMFFIRYDHNHGWAFHAAPRFLGLKATRIDITVQTD